MITSADSTRMTGGSHDGDDSYELLNMMDNGIVDEDGGGDAASELSKKMLDGWKLLAEHCPIDQCLTPLLKSSEGKIFCVKCKSYCITMEKAALVSSSKDPTVNRLGSMQVQGTSGINCSTSNGASTGRIAGNGDRQAADTRMGEKLLQGWTMLADTCTTPECFFPLLRDSEGRTSCVACEGSGNGAGDSGNDAKEGVNNNGPDHPMDSKMACVENILSSKDFAALRAKRDALSASLGRYILQGWVLLDQMCQKSTCEAMPLLSDRTSRELYCASCETRFKDNNGLLVASSEPEQKPASSLRSGQGHSDSTRNENTSPPSTPAKRGAAMGWGERPPVSLSGLIQGSTPGRPVGASSLSMEEGDETKERVRVRSQQRMEEGDNSCGNGGSTKHIDSSTLLADKLLEGWSMLSECCTSSGCNVPLMQDRSGAVVCVACTKLADDGYYGAKAGNTVRHCDSMNNTLVGQSRPMELESSAALHTPVSPSTHHRQHVYQVRKRESAQTGARGVGEEGRRVSLEAMEEGGDGTAGYQHIRALTLDSLYQEMNMSQQRLRASRDTMETMRIVELLAKLGKAVQAITDLQV